MLKFFNKGFFVQYAFTFVLGLLLWLPAIVMSPLVEEPNFYWGELAKVIFDVNTNFPVTGIILAYLLVYITALFINRMATDFGLVSKTSTLPLFVFIVMIGFSPSFHYMSPFIIILPLLMLLYLLLFKHYHNENNVFLSFDTGVILGIIALIYPPTAIVILVIWISLLSFKGISWRNFVVSLLGLLFPAFLAYSYYFFSGNESLAAGLFPIKTLFNFNLTYFPLSLNSLLNLILLLVSFISAIKVMQQQKNLTIQQRSHYTAVAVSIFLLLFVQLFLSLQLSTSLLLVPAAALTVSNMLSNSSLKSKWINLLLVSVVIVSLINSFLPMIYATWELL
ncbi:MAG: hypothetical protein DRJ09_01325 [Bacteroidetes bacterium]|nr:MAG: hypothetical protein DRJ09_01325 [Bacteroidota bacterium]